MLQRLFFVFVFVFLLSPGILLAQSPEKLCEAYVPVRAITKGPQSHWFSYYDKYQFDESGRYVLGMEIDFNNRAPQPDDVIRLGMADLEDGDRWIEFAQTSAWSWQQGCMLQWLPGSKSEVIYNSRREGEFISIVQDVFTGEKRVLPRAIYTVSPDGKWGLSVNFARLNDTRPGYGYVGITDPGADQLHPKEDGIFRVDLKTGEAKLIISLDQIAAIPSESPMDGEGKHWFNHLLFNPDGTRFIFLHRWQKQPDGEKGWYTRMFTASTTGEDIFRVADHGMVSHFIWRNSKQILAWSTEPETGNKFYLYTDQTSKKEIIGEEILTRDGHCTYSPDGTWILTDTYPDKERMQNLMLLRPSDSKLVKLGRFYLDKEFKGQTRCDLHGRWSRDGKSVCIDSLHSGKRQMYLLDISSIVK